MSDLPSDPAPSPAPLPDGLTLPVLAFLIFSANLFWQLAASEALQQTHFFGWDKGEETVSQALNKEDNASRRLARARLAMWTAALAFPGFVLTLPMLIRLFADLHAKDIGLTTENLARNLLTGCRAAVFLIPLVLLLNLLVQWWFKSAAGAETEAHPFTLLAETPLLPIEWALLFIGAVIAAPFYEEVLFRGVLQKWFEQTPWAGFIGLGLAAFMALAMRADGIHAAWGRHDSTIWLELAPLLFVLILVPHYLILRKRARTPAAAAIFASAVLFAAVHSFAWPTPVALLILGIALGWLARRQNSLAAPMALHATFNAFSAFALLLLSLLKR